MPPDGTSTSTVDGLTRLRKRLLDLTTRNKLLNFQHKGRMNLRVVDELPDQLFSRLMNDEVLIFKPVPEPRPSRTKIETDAMTKDLFCRVANT
ncbi:MAG: DUF4011 domain-containing protein [Nitrospirota bacterium]